MLVKPTAGQPRRGLRGEYFDTKDLSAQVMTRIDPRINFDWGDGSPDPAIAPNTFSVRWSGWLRPRYTETYTFSTRSNDGVRLWIDGKLIIDNWNNPAEQVAGQLALRKRKRYAIQIEYYENRGPAFLWLRWSSASQSLQVIPRSRLIPPGSAGSLTPTRTPRPTQTLTATNTGTLTATQTPSPTRTTTLTLTGTSTQYLTGTPTWTKSATPTSSSTATLTPTATLTSTPTSAGGDGLQGAYFGSKNLTSLKFTRTDPNIYFNWQDGAPDPSMSIDTFSVRWTGYIVPRYSERYDLIARSDDGVRLWINNQLVIDNWTDHLQTQDVGSITLTAGVRYPFKLEYYDNTGPSLITLRWRSASQALEVVPQSQLLTPGKGASPTPTRTSTVFTTSTRTVTFTATPTLRPTRTRTSTVTSTPTRTVTRTRTLTPTSTRTATRTRTPTPTNTPTPIHVPFFGLDVGLGGIVLQPDALRLAQYTGVSLVRDSVNWSSTEPVEGTFNFNGTDKYLNASLTAGFTPVIFITNNPGWASSIPCGPIDTKSSAKMAAFSKFVTTLVARYPQIKTWALYNEPDNADYAVNGYSSGGCFGDHKTGDLNANGVNDRTDYARMLAAAWKAVHQANPQAQLAMGAMAYDYFDPATSPAWYGGSNCQKDCGHFNYNFLPELLAYIKANPLPGSDKYMDLVLFNYFDGFAGIWESVTTGKGIQGKTIKLREQLTAAGFSFPLMVTESGVDSRLIVMPGQGGTAGQIGQASCLTMTMVRGQAADLRGVLWWTFKDFDSAHLHYGLVEDNLALKPAYNAYQTLTRELNGYQYAATRSEAVGLKNIEAYEFQKGAQTKLVLWSSKITTANYSALCASPRADQIARFGPGVTRLRFVELTGEVSLFSDNTARDWDPRVGYMGVPVTGSPLYVQPNP